MGDAASPPFGEEQIWGIGIEEIGQKLKKSVIFGKQPDKFYFKSIKQ